MLCIPRCGAVRGAARLVRPKITVIIRPKCKHFVLYSNSYLVVLNNYILSYEATRACRIDFTIKSTVRKAVAPLHISL
jgi:hypothetical protein